MASAYDYLASYYDYLQKELDYQVWVDLVNRYYKPNQTVLEVGCGTGKLANMLDLKPDCYNGFDLSKPMIDIALDKHSRYNFFVADGCSYQSDKLYDLVICFMDTVNYITELAKVEQLFNQVADNLVDGGIFMFDIHKEDNLDNFDGYLESGFINDNQYRWLSQVIDYDKCLVAHNFEFIINHQKYEEEHIQVIYEQEVYKNLLKNKFTVIDLIEDDYRYYFIVKKGVYNAWVTRSWNCQTCTNTKRCW